jgi:hypothetical protein
MARAPAYTLVTPQATSKALSFAELDKAVGHLRQLPLNQRNDQTSLCRRSADRPAALPRRTVTDLARGPEKAERGTVVIGAGDQFGVHAPFWYDR